MNSLLCAERMSSGSAFDSDAAVHRRGLRRAAGGYDGQRHIVTADRRAEFLKTGSGIHGPTMDARPISFPISPMISRSGLVPMMWMACFSSCTSPQTLVTVPPFS